MFKRFGSVRLLLAGVAAMGLLAGASCAPGSAPTATTGSSSGSTTPTAQASGAQKPAELRVALVDFLSGGNADVGTQAINAGKLAIDDINAKGGIGGVKITPIETDENGGPDKQVTEYRRLVLDEKADVVIGYRTSSDCLAVAPVAEELGKLTLISTCSSQRLLEDNTFQHVFRTTPHGAISAVTAARYLLAEKPDVKTVVGINPDFAWGRDGWAMFKATLQSLKPDVEVKDELWPKLSQGDYSAEITKILQTKPDAVFTTLFGGDQVAFMKQAGPRGLFDQSFTIFATGEDAVVSLGADLPKGIALSGSGRLLQYPDPQKYPAKQALIDQFVTKYGKPPAYPAYHMVEAVYGLKAAYEKAMQANGGKWPTQAEVEKAFDGLKWDSPAGPVEMRSDHQAVHDGVFATTTGNKDSKYDYPEMKDIKTFTVDQIMPPVGEKTLDWVKTIKN